MDSRPFVSQAFSSISNSTITEAENSLTQTKITSYQNQPPSVAPIPALHERQSKYGSQTLPPKGSLSLHLSPANIVRPTITPPPTPTIKSQPAKLPTTRPCPTVTRIPLTALSPPLPTLTPPRTPAIPALPNDHSPISAHPTIPPKPQRVRASASINPFGVNPPNPPCQTTLVPFSDTPLPRPAVRKRTAALPKSPPTPHSSHGNQLAFERVTLS